MAATDTNGFFSPLIYLLATLGTPLAMLLPLGRMRVVMLAAHGLSLHIYTVLLLYRCMYEVTMAACCVLPPWYGWKEGR